MLQKPNEKTNKRKHFLQTRSSAIAQRPRYASCCWVFWSVAEGCSK